MDKAKFVELAPRYYAMGIVHSINQNQDARILDQAVSRISVVNYFIVEESGDTDYYNYLEKDTLFDKGIEWLVARGIITLIHDDFGPTLYKKSQRFDEQVRQLAGEGIQPFQNFGTPSDAEIWLRHALTNVNKKYDELKVNIEDFELAKDVWEPIPIDRENAALQIAIEALDESIDAVRGDNGYSATVPEERALVIEKLSALSNKLKTDTTISWMYLKEFGLIPLGQVIARFGTAATGIVAVAAKDTLLSWMKSVGAKVVEFISKGWS